MRLFILAALLISVPLLAHGPTSTRRTSSGSSIALAAVIPAGASVTNETVTNAARSNIPALARSHTRTKAGVLAAGALIAITILIVACGLALLSSFKRR